MSFPLTLTLSLGEREQPPPRIPFAHTRMANSVAAMAWRRRTILPLPKGEGRGEEKENVAHPTVPRVTEMVTKYSALSVHPPFPPHERQLPEWRDLGYLSPSLSP